MNRPSWVTPPIEESLALWAVPAQKHSATSVAAAESLDGNTLNKLQRAVLELLHSEPAGLTDEEMAGRLGMNPSTQRPRRVELAKRGLVVKAGTRKTASGRSADVWKAAGSSL